MRTIKRFAHILSLILVAMLLATALDSCSSDNEKPKVNLLLSYTNATIVGAEVYVVQPDTFAITSVSVEAINKNHVATTGPVTYFINGHTAGTNPVMPFGIAIPTADYPLGAIYVELIMPLYEEDCTLATIATQIKVNIVESPEDIPPTTMAYRLGPVIQHVEYQYL